MKDGRTMMSDYTLYMDESETFNSAGYRYFVMSGVIIPTMGCQLIEQKLDQLKYVVWNGDPNCTQYILHEKDVSFASAKKNRRQLNKIPAYNRIFVSGAKQRLLYNELSKLFKQSKLQTIGVCLNKTSLHKSYGEKHMNDQLTIAAQFLIERYCQFLIQNAATGDICYEAMQQNQNLQIQQRLYELKALGTMYYSPETVQYRIREISFVAKQQNVAGLQLADFVPNTLGRYVAGKQPKNQSFAKNIRQTLYKGSAGGGKGRFGFKILD